MVKETEGKLGSFARRRYYAESVSILVESALKAGGSGAVNTLLVKQELEKHGGIPIDKTLSVCSQLGIIEQTEDGIRLASSRRFQRHEAD